MVWPGGADGDVFRRLELQGFDFSEPVWIDFNVDFEDWPPSGRAVEQVKREFPQAVTQIEEDEGDRYMLVRVFDVLSYELVIRMQSELSKVLTPFKGRCESWGVLH